MNVLIHLLLFSGTARLTKRKLSKKRLWAVSLISSCSIFVILTPFEEWLVHPLGKVMLSILLVWIGFGFISLSVFLQQLFMFYVMSFLIAGVITGMDMMRFSFVEDPALFNDYTSLLYSPLSILFVLSLLPLIWLMITMLHKTIRSRKARSEKTVQATVVIDNHQWEAQALLDTGNQLKDPVTRAPVMVMELQLVKSVLSKEEFEQCKDMLARRKIEELDKINVWRDRWKLIPYRAAGQEIKMMFAVKPDYIQLKTDGTLQTLTSILIGLDPYTLSSTGDFQMIVPMDALEPSKGNSA